MSVIAQAPRCPVLLVAATASGQGKTTVTAALARLHSRQGRTVRVFKCGPDFLDPFWLTLASGAPVHQLDLWMTGEADARQRLHEAALEADLILVEGVMGLFDGEPSAADLAARLGLPVMAVLDASAMAQTVGALAHGLKTFRADLPWAGVLANRVASASHGRMVQMALREPADFLGALPRQADMVLPERHLGLVAAQELPDALDRLDRAADALATTPLGQRDLASWTSHAVEFPAPGTVATVAPRLKGLRIAVARDAAFCFLYAANLQLLQAQGATLVWTSPLADTTLPACDALWLPGGYPELHADRLAANHSYRDSLVAHVAAGRPVWAECGGMMALFDTLVTRDGQVHRLWGLLPGQVSMQPRLVALGPQQWTTRHGVLRGHSFHFSRCDTPLPVASRAQRPASSWAPEPQAGEAMYRHGAVGASYFHAYFPSCPEAAAALFLPWEDA